MHTNMEIKARCKSHHKAKRILVNQGAEFRGTDNQVDTYFKTEFGRLKLRMGGIENVLVYYDRLDEKGPKKSSVLLYETKDPNALAQILKSTLQTLVVVEKTRGIYYIDNVKFHLDTVERLGDFIEIEAIDKDGSLGIEKIREQCEHYRGILEIMDEDLLAHSYSDMLLGSGK